MQRGRVHGRSVGKALKNLRFTYFKDVEEDRKSNSCFFVLHSMR